MTRTPATARSGLRGVAVDANALSKGRLSLPTLVGWADVLQRVALELWLPEPVAWELAEHAVQEYLASQTRFRSSRRWLVDAGLTVAEWADRSADDLIGECLARLGSSHKNLIVLPLGGPDALDALRDQVLLRPPATRKNATEKDKGVKTGASDIASVRLLHRHEPDSARFVLLSADTDWPEAFSACGWSIPRTFASWRHLRRELFTVVSSVEAGPALLSFVHDSLVSKPDRLGSVAGGGSFLDANYDHPTSVVSFDVVDVKAVAGVRDIETAQEAGEVSATVFLLADLDVSIQRYNEDDSTWSTESRPYADALLRGTVLLTVNDDVLLGEVTGSDEPFTVRREVTYQDSEDAFEEVLSAFRCVPGLEELDWPEAYDSRGSTWTGALANGVEVELTLDQSPYEEWTLEVLVDGASLSTVSCEHNADAWVGGSDGMYLDPPWTLVDHQGWARHPEFSASAALIARLLPRVDAPD